MTIRNLNWELETTFTRREIIQMGILAEYVSNIQNYLTEEFENCKKIDWTIIHNVMGKFAQLGGTRYLSIQGAVYNGTKHQ